MLDRFKCLLASEDGPTATEYAVMLGLVILVCIVGVTLLGTSVNGVFTTMSADMPDGNG